jgi:hypothetical protein
MSRKGYLSSKRSEISKNGRIEQKAIRCGEVLPSGSGFFFFFFLKPPGGV